MTNTKSMPKWATLDRQNLLVQLFLTSRGFCVFGHDKCQVPEHHYSLHIELLIKDWKSQDREQALSDWQAERKVIHSLGEMFYPLTGRFNAISKDIFATNQPLYYLQGQSVSGVNLKPFVKVRIASSYVRLYVDLGEALRQISKSRRRKALRYGKPFPREVEVIIRRKVLEAVRDYLAH